MRHFTPLAGLLALALPSGVHAQTYVVEPSIAAAQARSVQLCIQCDGVHTKYWLHVQALTDGTAALRVDAAAPYSATSAGLTAAEQSAAASLAGDTRLPWNISLPTFEARLTAANANALTSLAGASAVSALGSAWNAVKATAVTNLQSTQVATLLAAMVTAAIITPAQTSAITAPVAVAAVPP